jgi:predicted transposase YdaD
MSSNNNDAAWKEIIEKLTGDFLDYFMPDVSGDLDQAGGFTFLTDELQEIAPRGEEQNRYVDKLLKVRLRDKGEHWILIHVEIQGYKEKDFPKRMFRYFYRLMDKFDKDVTALAIFTDAHKTFKPGRYDYGCYGTKLRYEYRTFKVLDVSEEKELERSKENPFSLVVLTALEMIKAGNDLTKRLEYKTALTRRMVFSGFEPDKIRAMFRFIDVAVSLPPEMNRKMLANILNDKEIIKMQQEYVMGGVEKIIFDQGASKGKIEGERKGKLKGKIEVAKNMLAKKLPEKLIAEVSGLKAKDIERLKKQLAG